MPRPALTEAQRQATRRALRRAAAELAQEQGVTSVTARAVAERAGVSVGTLYTHFENLTALAQSLWKAPWARFLTSLEADAAAEPDPRARLRRLLAAYAEFATSHPGVYRGAFLFVRPAQEDQPTPMPLKDDRLFTLLCEAVTEGQQAGVFRGGPSEQLTQTLWAGMHGAVALPNNMDRLAFDPPSELLRHMTAALLEWLEQTD